MRVVAANLILLLLLSMISHETSAQRWRVNRQMKKLEENFNNHSGLMIYDPQREKVLYSYKADRYFTPASNTKILTLYTSLYVLGDKLPGLYYTESADSLIIWGSGDPSFLYKPLNINRSVFNFLKNADKPIYFSGDNFHDTHFGSGWAWDDYPYYYQVEKSPFPIYGNAVNVAKDSGKYTLSIDNNVFKKYFWLMDSARNQPPVFRDFGSNSMGYFPRYIHESFSRKVPFHYSPELVVELLSDTLRKEVVLINKPIPRNYQTIYSIPADSAYRVLMQTSDNFIAEQLLLMCSGKLFDSLKTDLAIGYAVKNVFDELPDKPLWVDGSGLSRYNLFTPESIVKIWDNMYKLLPEERLFNILAIGGMVGTIRNWYKNDIPYIYGKTGTLRNNHSLSGFLINEDGKVLIFSFMHNNYPTNSSEIKIEMEKILWLIRDKF